MSYLGDLNFHYVKNMLEILDIALLEEKVEKPVDLAIKEEKKDK
jgi:ATP-dependent Lon protease